MNQVRIHIRVLTVEDLPAIQSLVDESLREGFRFVQRFAGELPSLVLDTRDQWFLGVFDGTQLCAFGGVTPDPHAADTGVGRIRRVYVVPAMRGRGIGRILLDALEARALAVYPTLRLTTDTANAAAFYEHRGYARVTDPTATHIRVAPSIRS